MGWPLCPPELAAAMIVSVPLILASRIGSTAG